MSNDESLELQVYKLVNKCIYSKKSIINYYVNNNKSDIQDLVHNAYILVLNSIVKYYDSNRSALSTYVFNLINQNINVLIYQTNYNISYNSARILYNLKRNKNEKYDIYLGILQPKSLTVDSTALDIGDTGGEEDMVLPNIELSDSDLNPEYIIENEIIKDRINYLIYNFSKRKENPDKISDIIYSMLYRKSIGITISDIANKHNVSRQYVSCEWKRFLKQVKEFYLTKDNELN